MSRELSWYTRVRPPKVRPALRVNAAPVMRSNSSSIEVRASASWPALVLSRTRSRATSSESSHSSAW